MKTTISSENFQKLNIANQVMHVESLWDSISERVNELPVPLSHQRELKRRKQDAKKNPGAMISYDEFMSRLNKWL
ncbi:MAG: addiction module protein [Fibrobacteres bacterium]|nr:addiction module protein [Fibrobacterota bacterium]